MVSDEQRRLVERARQRDADAWVALYRAVGPRLRSYVASRVPPAAVDDVVSETMTRAVAGIDGFRWTDAGFDGWLFGIARRASVDAHRSEVRAARDSGSLDRSSTGAPDDRVLLAEEHVAVRKAFDQLGPDDREVLELRVIAGLTADETAAVLGKRAGAVRTAQSRALARLRDHLDGQS